MSKTEINKRNTYWNHKGKYEEDYHKIWERIELHNNDESIVLTDGEQALGDISSIYYDYYNNGSCNTFDSVNYEDGYFESDDPDSYYERDYLGLRDDYKKRVERIAEYLKSDEIACQLVDALLFEYTERTDDGAEFILELVVSMVISKIRRKTETRVGFATPRWIDAEVGVFREF